MRLGNIGKGLAVLLTHRHTLTNQLCRFEDTLKIAPMKLLNSGNSEANALEYLCLDYLGVKQNSQQEPARFRFRLKSKMVENCQFSGLQ